MKIYAEIKENFELTPMSEKDQINFNKLKPGDHIQIEKWKERNIRFHKKFFALLNCTIYHMPEHEEFDKYRNIEYFRKYLMIIIGHCDVIIGITGKENYVPKSINFKTLDDDKFSDIYSKALNAILKYFLKGISQADFEADILNFL